MVISKVGVSRKQSTPNFPKNKHFLPSDTHTRLRVKNDNDDKKQLESLIFTLISKGSPRNSNCLIEFKKSATSLRMSQEKN